MKKNVSFSFNGSEYIGEEGQSVAAALLASGVTQLRSTRFNEKPRTIFCGIGVCFDCVVAINGVANQRACIVTISEGAQIVSSQ
jgi:aerobic-type carbon monoxide dehydrogenase small subunit (CoxS/CutS family)